MIKKQIQKASALHDAQVLHTSYRGVEYKVGSHEEKETHGTFNYRGNTYQKWYSLNEFKGGLDDLLFFVYN